MKVFALISAVLAQEGQISVNGVENYGSLVYTTPTVSTQLVTDGKDNPDNRFVLNFCASFLRFITSGFKAFPVFTATQRI